MKILIGLLVFVFGSQRGINCISDKTTQSSKDVELVDSLKQELRRNNDDYIDRSNITDTTPSPPTLVLNNKQSGADNIAKTNVKDQLIDYIVHKKPNLMFQGKEAKRRYIDYNDEINYNKYSFSPATAIATTTGSSPKRFHKASMSTKPTTSRLTKTKPDQINLEMFKKFMVDNKDLIKDFVKKIGESTTESMPTLERSEENKEPRARSSEERQLVTPPQHLLDMAPANGGSIHSLRIHGRLCQRNVLVPEGPKYNSKGEVYLPAFSRGGREYHHTKKPKLILPKCCNCCRKSVLGCE